MAAAGLTLFTPEEIGLRLSPGIFDGGVNKLPTLTDDCDGWGLMEEVLICVYGRYFCASCCGGGSSKLGKFVAAGRRAVRLEPAPGGSILDAIPV